LYFIFTIVRDAVPLPTIRNSYMIRPGTGYIGLTGGFQRSSDEELAKSMKRLEEQGMRQLILDLRGNPGGLLDQAIDVASEFLPRGAVVVSVKVVLIQRADYLQINRLGADDRSVSRSDQSQQRLGVGNRRGCDSGSRPRLDYRRDEFWQGPRAALSSSCPSNTGLTLTTARYYTPYGRSLQTRLLRAARFTITTRTTIQPTTRLRQTEQMDHTTSKLRLH
jgi:carboxyl-terminal processing protease